MTVAMNQLHNHEEGLDIIYIETQYDTTDHSADGSFLHRPRASYDLRRSSVPRYYLPGRALVVVVPIAIRSG